MDNLKEHPIFKYLMNFNSNVYLNILIVYSLMLIIFHFYNLKIFLPSLFSFIPPESRDQIEEALSVFETIMHLNLTLLWLLVFFLATFILIVRSVKSYLSAMEKKQHPALPKYFYKSVTFIKNKKNIQLKMLFLANFAMYILFQGLFSAELNFMFEDKMEVLTHGSDNLFISFEPYYIFKNLFLHFITPLITIYLGFTYMKFILAFKDFFNDIEKEKTLH